MGQNNTSSSSCWISYSAETTNATNRALARQVTWIRCRKSRNLISARELPAKAPALDLHGATARR
jgi:hypothetical protein